MRTMARGRTGVTEMRAVSVDRLSGKRWRRTASGSTRLIEFLLLKDPMCTSSCQHPARSFSPAGVACQSLAGRSLQKMLPRSRWQRYASLVIPMCKFSCIRVMPLHLEGNPKRRIREQAAARLLPPVVRRKSRVVPLLTHFGSCGLVDLAAIAAQQSCQAQEAKQSNQAGAGTTVRGYISIRIDGSVAGRRRGGGLSRG